MLAVNTRRGRFMYRNCDGVTRRDFVKALQRFEVSYKERSDGHFAADVHEYCNDS